MKPNFIHFLIGASALTVTGCQNPDGTQNNTAAGALIGGAIGAITGAAIGGSRHGGEGALIGAAAGVIGGGLIGNSMDQEQNARLRQQAPQTYAKVEQGQPLSLADVKALAVAEVSDDVIINQIRSSRTVFHLSSADIIELKNAGVDEKVMDFMINTPSTIASSEPASQSVVAGPPPPAPVETVTVAPGPDYVWVGGEWVWNGGWVWVAGHWLFPPYPHAVWIRGGWERGPHGYRRVGGRWN